ncbi:MAG: purine-nucleoside phosphorylase [Anaerolineales bacterium]
MVNTPFLTVEQVDEAVAAVCDGTHYRPKIGLILGSGLGALADSILEPDLISSGDLPNWPKSTVDGHSGRLVFGRLENQVVMVLQGRIHAYEGYSMSQVTFPVRVMQRLGVEILIATNAAGAVNPDFTPGELMLISDHLNLIGMAGMNPLIGPNLDQFGPRFPDMSQAYDRELNRIARRLAQEHHIPLRDGVYVGLSGPSYESPADLRFLRLAGADAVGMSTVPEVIVARHAGMRVLGISGISNKANLDGNTKTSHEEVLEAGKVIAPKLEKLLRAILREL